MAAEKRRFLQVGAWISLFVVILALVYLEVVYVEPIDRESFIADTRNRVVEIDDPEVGELIFYTMGGEVGGDMKDVATLLHVWRQAHPEFVPRTYHLVVRYAPRDSSVPAGAGR